MFFTLSLLSPLLLILCYIMNQIFTLPQDTLLYPAHDYKGFTVRTKDICSMLSCLGQMHIPKITADTNPHNFRLQL